MSHDTANERIMERAQRAYDAMEQPQYRENPDCPECGTTMGGAGDKWEWNFDCPKCGCNVSGDNF